MKARLALATMIAAAAIAVPGEARADWRVAVGVSREDHGREWREHGDARGGPAFRYGFDRGWREGSEEGYRDGRRACDPRFWREGEFREASRGYKRWMGPRWEYADGFRAGYRGGYRRAYAAARPGWRGRWERYGWRDTRHDDPWRR